MLQRDSIGQGPITSDNGNSDGTVNCDDTVTTNDASLYESIFKLSFIIMLNWTISKGLVRGQNL